MFGTTVMDARLIELEIGPVKFPSFAICVLCLPLTVRAESPRVVIVVRQGTLTGEEVSPRSPGGAVSFWTLAIRGVTVAEISLPQEWSADSTLQEIEQTLFSESVRDLSRDKRLLLDLKPGGGVFSDADESIGGLFDIVRAPTETSNDETKKSKDEAATSKDEDESGEAATDAHGKKKSVLGALDRARVTLLRVRATGKRRRDVRRRDRILSQVVKTVGDQAYVFVVNVPRKGPGSVVAVGPALKSGIVLGRKRSFRFFLSALEQTFRTEKERSRHDLFR